MKLAIVGDAIITRPVSQITDSRATAIFDLLRGADLAFLNCETVLDDYHGAGVGVIARRTLPITPGRAWPLPSAGLRMSAARRPGT